MSDLHEGDLFAELRSRIDAWAYRLTDGDSAIAAIDRGTADDTPLGEPRWYIRTRGEEKDFITVWLTLGQRTVRYETYVLPAPEENVRQVSDLLLRRNDTLIGCHFSIGDEDAIYLRGELPDIAVTEDELDRILGTLYAAVEANFRPLLRLAFASRFAS